MTIDLDRALSAEPTVHEAHWTSRDVLLYHLSLGAGASAEAGPELRYTFEQDLQVLPTFALVAGQGISAGQLPAVAMSLPGIDIDLRRILHGGQSLTVHRPIPPSGTATVSSRVANVWDKGKAAVIELEQVAVDPAGDRLWTTTMQIWARGEGGFGGVPGPDAAWIAPDRAPDLVVNSATTPQTALLYRLNGDLNPLHADPAFAAAAGFDRPILHGLCTYGFTGRALLHSLAGSDPARLRTMEGRFSKPVFPGDSLTVRMWVDGEEAVFTTETQNGDVVIDQGRCTFTS